MAATRQATREPGDHPRSWLQPDRAKSPRATALGRRTRAPGVGYHRGVTERGLPVVDGAPACPFVAFADDRDARATSPDHRHRCYAEARPAPRALAHQEAYCLASAFPVCPTFQDWARREAATALADPTRSPAPTGSPAASAGAGLAASTFGRAEDAERVPAPGFLASRDRAGGGLAGSAADRLASESAGSGHHDSENDIDRDEAVDRQAAPEPPTRPQAAAPAFTGGAAASSASSAAARDAAAWQDDEVARQDEAWDRRSGQPAPPGPNRPRREPNPAPAFERARRESYPTRRTPVRLRNLSPLAIAAIAIFVVALLLFLAPGFLRNLGSGSPQQSQVAGATASPAASATSSPSASPSPTPAASTYVVQAGDTLSQIAQRFGVSLDALIAANSENLPDPNDLQIGDELIIPAGDATPAPSASGSALP